MSDSKQLRLNNLRGHLRTKTLEYLDTWEALHADVKYIHDLSRGNKLKGKRSTQARQIEALAIMFWAQKHKAPLEQCCDDHEMIRQLARRLYFFAGKCNRKDTTLFAKIGLRWHDIFPSWIPSSIKAFVKLITLASSVAGLAIMKKRPRKEAQEELKALAATAPQATEPTANIIGGILARFEAHKNAISKCIVQDIHMLPSSFPYL